MAADKGAGGLAELGAVELRDRLASGALRAVELADALLDRIERLEPEIGAWAWRDPDYVRHQARELDRYRETGRPIGALHGLPVGVKDIIDTAGIPTENGCSIDAGRVPDADAFVVSRLKAAGAIMMGKTVTTELASAHPSATRNPHDSQRTPGGSSAGSAAGVAAGMIPLAIGTQTQGSVIRPAAFCGVTGFKPTFGAIPRTGVLAQALSLDTVGVFARDPLGAALLAEALFGYDPADKATAPAPHPQLWATAHQPPPLLPVFAYVRPPGWDRADEQTKLAFDELTARLGEQSFEAGLPAPYEAGPDLSARVNRAEMAHCFHRYMRDGADRLGVTTRDLIETGAKIVAKDYLAALDWRDVLYTGLSEILARADAILTPAALGPAPTGLTSTGDPVFNSLWTFCGVPAVTLPILASSDGMPMGVQLVGARGADARLLRTANWLYDQMES